MQQLANVFVDIAFHRKGPDALPASRFLFGLVLVAYLTVSLLALQINWPLRQAVGIVLLDAALHLLFLGLVLSLMQRSFRFWQTVTAAFGAETFLGALALPLHLLLAVAQEAGITVVIATVLLLSLLVWSIDIAGFILARAIDRTYIVGVMIMIGYALGSMTLGEFLFPSPE